MSNVGRVPPAGRVVDDVGSAIRTNDHDADIPAGVPRLPRDPFITGRVYERCADPAQSRASFAEIAEIADIIIPGHDNLIVAL